MKRRVATITLNPAYDLVGLCSSINTGRVNRVQTAGFHAAGKGINVAKVLRQLTIDVTVGGFLGNKNPSGFLNLFDEFAMVNRFFLIDGETRVNVKLTEHSGIVTDFNFSGFSINNTDWENFARDSLVWLAEFDMVVVSGSLPNGVELAAFSDWMSQLRACCPYLIFDSSREALAAGLKAAPWLVKPNHHELEIWAGRPLPELNDIVKVARQWQQQGIVHVVVSLGEAGALWVNHEGAWLAKPPKCRIVSTVGAGDAMVAGLAYGLLMEKPYDDILRLATALSALAVSQSNVGITDSLQLSSILSQVSLDSL